MKERFFCVIKFGTQISEEKDNLAHGYTRNDTDEKSRRGELGENKNVKTN